MSQNIRLEEFDTFGQHVANQRCILSIIDAIERQSFINSYLAKASITFLKSQHHSTSKYISTAFDDDDASDTLTPSPTTPISSASNSTTRDTFIRRPNSSSMSSLSDYTQNPLICK